MIDLATKLDLCNFKQPKCTLSNWCLKWSRSIKLTVWIDIQFQSRGRGRESRVWLDLLQTQRLGWILLFLTCWRSLGWFFTLSYPHHHLKLFISEGDSVLFWTFHQIKERSRINFLFLQKKNLALTLSTNFSITGQLDWKSIN